MASPSFVIFLCVAGSLPALGQEGALFPLPQIFISPPAPPGFKPLVEGQSQNAQPTGVAPALPVEEAVAQGQGEPLPTGELPPPPSQTSSEPYLVIGQAPDATTSNQVPNPARGLIQLLLPPRQKRSPAPHHEPGHVGTDDHDHAAHGHTEADHKHDHDNKEGEVKSRKKRTYCSKCGGGGGGYGGGLGGYGGGGYGQLQQGYGGGGYGGGGCGGRCGGGGRQVYQQPIYQQPIYQQPSYGGGGGTCSVCGRPVGGGGYGGGGYGGGGGQSYSQSQSSASSSSYGKK